MTDQPKHRPLLARLEAERAHHESCTALSRVDEARIAHSSMAAGLHLAALRLVEEYDGPEAAREYMQRTTSGRTKSAPDDALREQYAAAIDKLRDSGGVYSLEDHERDRIAEAVLAVRDRRMEQLGQYADRGIANGERAEQAEAERGRLAAVLREVLDQFALWPKGGTLWPDGGVVAKVSVETWDRWDALVTRAVESSREAS